MLFLIELRAPFLFFASELDPSQQLAAIFVPIWTAGLVDQEQNQNSLALAQKQQIK